MPRERKRGPSGALGPARTPRAKARAEYKRTQGWATDKSFRQWWAAREQEAG